jgi:hypothetical protein
MRAQDVGADNAANDGEDREDSEEEDGRKRPNTRGTVPPITNATRAARLDQAQDLRGG